MNDFANEIPVNDVMDGSNATALNEANSTDYRNMSDTELDTSIAESNTTMSANDTPEPVVEDGLHPSEVEPSITIEDFAEPLADYEVDNLHYALAETPQGTDVLIALHKNDGVVTDDIVDLALEAGVSQRQIESYISAQMHEANKIFTGAGLSLADGKSLVTRAKAEFSAEEWKIFTDETNVDAVKSMQTLKAYYEL